MGKHFAKRRPLTTYKRPKSLLADLIESKLPTRSGRNSIGIATNLGPRGAKLTTYPDKLLNKHHK